MSTSDISQEVGHPLFPGAVVCTIEEGDEVVDSFEEDMLMVVLDKPNSQLWKKTNNPEKIRLHHGRR